MSLEKLNKGPMSLLLLSAMIKCTQYIADEEYLNFGGSSLYKTEIDNQTLKYGVENLQELCSLLQVCSTMVHGALFVRIVSCDAYMLHDV